MLGTLLITMGIASILFVLWPVFRGTRQRWEYSEEDTPLGRLAVRREVLIANLADLDFEFAMGKLAEEEYRALREGLKRQTLRIMEQIEVLRGSDIGPAASGSLESGTCSSCQGELPPQARFCPSCGSPTGRG